MSDWQQARELVQELGLDGYEIASYGRFEASAIPADLVHGFHLSFHPQFHLLWQGDEAALLARFGSWEVVEQMFGCTDIEGLIEQYRFQLNLAHQLGAKYVVFHPAIVDGDGIYTQQFEWSLQQSLELCAELLNRTLIGSPFDGWLLMENLWWKQSFRLQSRDEYDYLKSRIRYHKVGICLDTGHFMACDWRLDCQERGIDNLLTQLKRLELSSEIKTLHLTASLGGHHLTPGTQAPEVQGDWWAQFERILTHVSSIDPHLPFTTPKVQRLFEQISPQFLVHEMAQPDLVSWKQHIQTQQRALGAPHLAKESHEPA